MPMPRKQILFLIFASIIAIGTVLAARSLLTPDELEQTTVAATAEPTAAPVEVLVVKKDLPAGSFLAAEDVEWKSWPAESVTDGMLKKGVAEEKSYVGAVVRTGLRAGRADRRWTHPKNRRARIPGRSFATRHASDDGQNFTSQRRCWVHLPQRYG